MGAVRQNLANFVMKTPALRRAVASLFPEVLALSARESEQLLKDIENPPPANDKLKAAFARYEERHGTVSNVR